MILLVLILLHGPDNYPVQINPEQITALRTERNVKEHERMYPKGGKCLISLTDGKNLAVTEDCDTVRRLIEGR